MHGYQSYVLPVRARGADARRTSSALHERRNARDGGARGARASRRGRARTRRCCTGLYASKYGLRAGGLPERACIAERLTLALPLYPQMTDARVRSRRRTRCCGAFEGGLDDVRHRGRARLAGRAGVARRVLQRMTDAIAHRGPDGEGQYVDGAGRLGQPPPGDHRPVAARARSRWRPPTGGSCSPTTARSTTSASCAASSRRCGHAFRSQHRQRSRAQRLRRVGRRRASSASTACSRSRSGTARERRAVPRARPLRHQAAVLRDGRRRVRCSARRSRRCSRTRPFAPELDRRSAARVLHVPEHLHRPHAVRGRPAAARRAPS